MHKPHKSHFNIVLRLLRYLKSNIGKGVYVNRTRKLGRVGFVDVWMLTKINVFTLVDL